MRLYTRKKFHAKSPVAARITYSVRDYENTRGVAEGTRVFFRRAHRSPVASPSPFFLRTPPAVPSPSTNPVLFARAILAPGLSFSGGSRMSTALRQQRVPLEDLGEIVNTSVPRSHAIFRARQDSECLIRIFACTAGAFV